ncbi:glucose-6-phosphate dehydrogenase 5 [Striga asiatica]|uniref:Glucose-6-phosphate dehydrogenase 5 n=1 Tax=Striga asiatica TaxID=4170 RepID=A0A5A7PUL6_STRAF|nr:glucose-6-phosphate dehydrogenase 5 [Striga asiatica]
MWRPPVLRRSRRTAKQSGFRSIKWWWSGEGEGRRFQLESSRAPNRESRPAFASVVAVVSKMRPLTLNLTRSLWGPMLDVFGMRKKGGTEEKGGINSEFGDFKYSSGNCVVCRLGMELSYSIKGFQTRSIQLNALQSEVKQLNVRKRLTEDHVAKSRNKARMYTNTKRRSNKLIEKEQGSVPGRAKPTDRYPDKTMNTPVKEVKVSEIGLKEKEKKEKIGSEKHICINWSARWTPVHGVVLWEVSNHLSHVELLTTTRRSRRDHRVVQVTECRCHRVALLRSYECLWVASPRRTRNDWGYCRWRMVASSVSSLVAPRATGDVVGDGGRWWRCTKSFVVVEQLTGLNIYLSR